jgi:hypothetical protein
MEFRDCKVVHTTRYFAEGFDAPPSQYQWIGAP